MVLESVESEGFYLFRTESEFFCMEPVFDEGTHSHDPLTFMSDLSRICRFRLYEMPEEGYQHLRKQYDEYGELSIAELGLEPISVVPYAEFHGIEELMED